MWESECYFKAILLMNEEKRTFLDYNLSCLEQFHMAFSIKALFLQKHIKEKHKGKSKK